MRCVLFDGTGLDGRPSDNTIRLDMMSLQNGAQTTHILQGTLRFFLKHHPQEEDLAEQVQQIALSWETLGFRFQLGVLFFGGDGGTYAAKRHPVGVGGRLRKLATEPSSTSRTVRPVLLHARCDREVIFRLLGRNPWGFHRRP